jgi:hypothetical protein
VKAQRSAQKFWSLSLRHLFKEGEELDDIGVGFRELVVCAVKAKDEIPGDTSDALRWSELTTNVPHDVVHGAHRMIILRRLPSFDRRSDLGLRGVLRIRGHVRR